MTLSAMSSRNSPVSISATGVPYSPRPAFVDKHVESPVASVRRSDRSSGGRLVAEVGDAGERPWQLRRQRRQPVRRARDEGTPRPMLREQARRRFPDPADVPVTTTTLSLMSMCCPSTIDKVVSAGVHGSTDTLRSLKRCIYSAQMEVES